MEYFNETFRATCYKDRIDNQKFIRVFFKFEKSLYFTRTNNNFQILMQKNISFRKQSSNPGKKSNHFCKIKRNIEIKLKEIL